MGLERTSSPKHQVIRTFAPHVGLESSLPRPFDPPPKFAPHVGLESVTKEEQFHMT